MTHTALDISQPLPDTLWERVNDFSLWVHGQHDLDILQKGTLERVGEVIPHRISMFDLVQLDETGQVKYLRPVSTTMSREYLGAYYERYAAMDYTTWSFDLHAVNVYRDLDLVDVERRDQTPIFREWMEPQNVYFGCSATLAASNIPLGTLTLFREREADDFSSAEMRSLKEFAKHVSLRLHELFPMGLAQADIASQDPIDVLIAQADIKPREADVLRLMAAGNTNKEMAAALFISESTVKKHVNAVYRKLDVSNRMGLMARLRDL